MVLYPESCWARGGEGCSDIRYPVREEETLSQQTPVSAWPQGGPSPAGGRVEGKAWHRDRCPGWQSQNGAVSASPRAEGSGQPSLAAGGCHPHIKRPAELLCARTEQHSPAKQEPGGTGTRGCHQLRAPGSHHRCWLGCLVLQTPAGCKGLFLLSPSRTQPQSVLDPSNPVWAPSGLSRKGTNNGHPNILGCWG